MSKQKTIFIHIGHHKTGSTSIQQSLIKNKKKLKENNFSYYSGKPNGKKDSHVSSWIKPLRSKNNDNLGEIVQMDLLAKKSSQSTTKNVIISSEEFSWINNKNCLTKLKGSLKKYFDKIYIVVYIRRQDSQVISFCQEEAKSGGMVESSFFNCGNKSIPKYQKIFDEYLDYNKRLSLWADVFKDENLFIRIFEKNHLYKNDVVLDFFKILGVKNNIKLDRHNESWGFEKTKVAYLLEKNKINKYFKKHILKGLDNTGKLLPSINEAKKFYNNYIESNIKLNMRFDLNNKNKSIFSNDFTNYPKENADSWDENSANSAITNIIQSINNINQKDLLYILIKSKLFNFKKKIYNFRKKFM